MFFHQTTLSSPRLNEMPPWSVGALDAVLNDIDILGMSKPTVIIDEKAVPPYAHYSMMPGCFNQVDCFAKRKSTKSQFLVLPNAMQLLKEDPVNKTISEQSNEVGTAVSISPALSQRDNRQSPVKLDFTDFKPMYVMAYVLALVCLAAVLMCIFPPI